MANYGLDLQQKKKNKKHRTAVFVICFLIFAILLGTASTLLWWRSLNYNFENIFKKSGETEVTEITTLPAEDVTFEGKYVFMLAVASDDLKETYFANLISVDLGSKTIRIVPVSKNTVDSDTGKTFEQLISQKTYSKAVGALSSAYKADICRYAVFTESGCKSMFRLFGDITLKIPQDVNHDTPDMFLELPKGENTLTPDQAHKYLKYICESQDDKQASESAASVVAAAFSCYYNTENDTYSDSLFEDIYNICSDRGGSTDISIVDYSNAADAASYLVPHGSKEKLKVFVSNNLNSEESE